MNERLYPTVPVYECVDGCYIDGLRAEYDELSGTYQCPRCCCQAKVAGERPAEWSSVAVYYTRREYGGPEEGGWWYDAGRMYEPTLRNFGRGDFPQMLEYIELLKRRFPESNAEIRQYDEKVAPARYPETRPFYC